MIAPVDAALALSTAAGAAALCAAEVLGAGRLPGHLGCELALRRWPLRAVALALVAGGLRRLAEGTAALVWHDLNLFLLRPSPPAGPAGWGVALALVWCGLVLVRASLPPAPAATLGGLLAGAAAATWLVLTRLLPLADGHGWQLGAVTVAVAAPGFWLAVAVGRPAPEEAAAVRRLLLAVRRSGLVALVTAPLWLTDRWPPGATVAPALAALGLVAVLLTRLYHDHGGPFEPVSWCHDLAAMRRPAWILLAATVGLAHGALLAATLPALAGEGRRVMREVAAWPQVATGRAEPTEADWQALATRLDQTVVQFGGHAWCGQWLLIEAWIESSRLHHFYTATLQVRQARHSYPRSRAVAPPGWPAGHTVRQISERVLTEWGRLVDPGSRPS